MLVAEQTSRKETLMNIYENEQKAQVKQDTSDD